MNQIVIYESIDLKLYGREEKSGGHSSWAFVSYFCEICCKSLNVLLNPGTSFFFLFETKNIQIRIHCRDVFKIGSTADTYFCLHAIVKGVKRHIFFRFMACAGHKPPHLHRKGINTFSRSLLNRTTNLSGRLSTDYTHSRTHFVYETVVRSAQSSTWVRQPACSTLEFVNTLVWFIVQVFI